VWVNTCYQTNLQILPIHFTVFSVDFTILAYCFLKRFTFIGANNVRMKEIFIHYLWENKLLQHVDHTTDNEPVEIIHPGFRNAHAGPDFLNARINIGGTLWAGNVEIHVNASDWLLHNHQHDKAYDNVILHVVFQEDKKISNSENRQIPTIEIENKFDEDILFRYNSFITSQRWIACEKHITEIQHFTWLSWLDRLIVEKMETKVGVLQQSFEESQNDWEETFYRRLMTNLGLKVNDAAFEQLARAVPFNLLLRHADKLHELEALLFGQAGMLEKKFKDEYPNKLRETYHFLAQKHDLRAMNESAWRFMRLRPVNFPTIRIAQFASMVHKHKQLFSNIIETESVTEIANLFRCKASAYWDTHFQFDKASGNKQKQLGEQSAQLLMVNSVVQILFFYGKYIHKDLLTEKALMILESAEAEDNQVIRKFTTMGVDISNALQSQSLLFLKSTYCDPKRCLECRVGQILLKQATDL